MIIGNNRDHSTPLTTRYEALNAVSNSTNCAKA